MIASQIVEVVLAYSPCTLKGVTGVLTDVLLAKASESPRDQVSPQPNQTFKCPVLSCLTVGPKGYAAHIPYASLHHSTTARLRPKKVWIFSTLAQMRQELANMAMICVPNLAPGSIRLKGFSGVDYFSARLLQRSYNLSQTSKASPVASSLPRWIFWHRLDRV